MLMGSPISGEGSLRNLLWSLLGGGARSALNLVLPIHCLGCGRQGDIICPTCVPSLVPLEPPFCDICADPGVVGLCRTCRDQQMTSSGHISGIRSPYQMAGLLREAIHCFKYRNHRVAATCLAKLMASYLGENPLPGDVLVPVPLHPKKLRERGYNQAELLAVEIGKAAGLRVERGLLARTRNTPPQVHSVDGNLRRANTAGAFACGGNIAGAACILVDDVCTTGSTLNACAETLLANGASTVWALTLARERLGIAPLGV